METYNSMTEYHAHSTMTYINTDNYVVFILGVYSDQGPGNFDVVIDVAGVQELYGISVSKFWVETE